MSAAALAVGALVATAAGCGGKTAEPKPLPAPPAIKTFAADKTRIAAGQSATLSFTVENATQVELIDGQGQAIATEGTPASGTAQVTPSASEVYVLRAKGDGGRDSAFVRVGVDEDLSNVFLAAVPPEIEAGHTAQLIWTAYNAASATLTASNGDDLGIDPAAGSGIVEVTPSRSDAYLLTAAGSNPEHTGSATATVSVAAVLDAFTASSSSAHVGDVVHFTWQAQAADEVILSEALLGELKRVTFAGEPAEVANGSFDWTVPTDLPDGTQVSDGQPFRFTLTVNQTTPAMTLTAKREVYVGEGPQILQFEAPAAVTSGQPVPISWTTANALKVTLLVNGQAVFESLPSDTGRAVSGSYTLPSIGQDLTVELVAQSYSGATATSKLQVARVAAPAITSFTAPGTVATPSLGADLAWTTTDATEVTVRVQNGPVVFSTAAPADVAQGTTKVYPGTATTYVLEAWNSAGDRAAEQKLITVGTPDNVSAAPSPALPGTQVDVSWDLDPALTSDVLGVPSDTPVLDPTAAEWVELDGYVGARELFFDNANDGMAQLPLTTPFRFPLVTGVREAFWVSTNGFVTFAPQAASPQNADLTQAGGFEMLAPFWDDLDLGTGKVFYGIDGTAFPRRLVVEWKDVSVAADPASKLTFQVQMDEAGRFRFIYLSMTGTDAGGENATVGVKVGPGAFVAQRSFNPGGPVVASLDQQTWFSGGSLTGAYSVYPMVTSNYGFVARLQGGKFVTYSLPVWVFAPGSVVVTEAMPEPGAGLTAGRWVELHNAQNMDVNLKGLEVTSTSSAQPFTLPELWVPAKGFVVLGDSVDPLENGDAQVDVAWTGVTLTQQDSAQVQLMGTPLSNLDWTSANPGESAQAPERAIDAQGAPIVCTRSQTFGNGFIGTPGAANEVCFDYTLTAIPGDFEDLSGTGTAILASASSYTGTGTFDLPEPFTYFGQPQTKINVSMVGFFTFGPPLADAYNNSNDTTPGSPAPNGVVAPFWDEIVRNANGDIFMERKADHTTISWQDFRIYATTSSLNFQVKLFDSGVIEFHYGTMAPPSSGNDATGSSATTWIEALDGSSALPVNINTAGGILPHTGWRFTPNP